MCGLAVHCAFADPHDKCVSMQPANLDRASTRPYMDGNAHDVRIPPHSRRRPLRCADAGLAMWVGR